jgi:hypothetical protein
MARGWFMNEKWFPEEIHIPQPGSYLRGNVVRQSQCGSHTVRCRTARCRTARCGVITVACEPLTLQQTRAEHNTAEQSRAEQSRAQHSTAQHSTAQHSTAQHRVQRKTEREKVNWGCALFDEAKGSVVNRRAADQAIVRIEVRLCVPDTHPLRTKLRELLRCRPRHPQQLSTKLRI